MSGEAEIVRIAARGDGVTAEGRHVPGTAPGDLVAEDGAVRPGPHRVTPPCRHFARCGGCQLQHVDEAELARFVTERVIFAAKGQDLDPEVVALAHLSPPGSRRRATLHAASIGGKVVLGYREEGSHRIVDLAECPVLAPALLALVAPLRKMLGAQGRKLSADVSLTLVDQGVDVAIKGMAVVGLTATEAVLDFARDNGLARLSLDQGFGPEALWEPEPVTITLSGVPVSYPFGSFLQATADGEAALTGAAREWLDGVTTIADLFSGLGTFAFALAAQGARVLAVEAARDAHLACKAASGRAQAQLVPLHRDLFRNPLLPDELNRFGGVLLDPPRAGAREQIARLVQSKVPRIVYVSCNPASWARDAAMLVGAGWRLAEVRPVGQFRWSTHVELASLFLR